MKKELRLLLASILGISLFAGFKKAENTNAVKASVFDGIDDFAASISTSGEQTIVLDRDIQRQVTDEVKCIAINEGATITIDLNNHTINGGYSFDNQNIESLFNVYGTLNIVDNSDLGLGRITNCYNSSDGGVFSVHEGGLLNCYHVTFTNNFSSGCGGVISSAESSTINIKDCYFEQNSGSQGGAIRCLGKLVVDGSSFVNNKPLDKTTTPTGYGGAIYMKGSKDATNPQIISNSQFVGNEAVSTSTSYGGAVYVSNGAASFTNCLFEANKASEGGAVFGIGDIDICGSNFVSNVGEGGNRNLGGAVYIETTTATSNVIDDCDFTSNKGTTIVDVLIRNGGSLQISNGTFDQNETINNGACLSCSAKDLTLDSLIFKNNKLKIEDGASGYSYNTNINPASCVKASVDNDGFGIINNLQLLNNEATNMTLVTLQNSFKIDGLIAKENKIHYTEETYIVGCNTMSGFVLDTRKPYGNSSSDNIQYRIKNIDIENNTTTFVEKDLEKRLPLFYQGRGSEMLIEPNCKILNNNIKYVDSDGQTISEQPIYTFGSCDTTGPVTLKGNLNIQEGDKNQFSFATVCLDFTPVIYGNIDITDYTGNSDFDSKPNLNLVVDYEPTDVSNLQAYEQDGEKYTLIKGIKTYGVFKPVTVTYDYSLFYLIYDGENIRGTFEQASIKDNQETFDYVGDTYKDNDFKWYEVESTPIDYYVVGDLSSDGEIGVYGDMMLMQLQITLGVIDLSNYKVTYDPTTKTYSGFYKIVETDVLATLNEFGVTGDIYYAFFGTTMICDETLNEDILMDYVNNIYNSDFNTVSFNVDNIDLIFGIDLVIPTINRKVTPVDGKAEIKIGNSLCAMFVVSNDGNPSISNVNCLNYDGDEVQLEGQTKSSIPNYVTCKDKGYFALIDTSDDVLINRFIRTNILLSSFVKEANAISNFTMNDFKEGETNVNPSATSLFGNIIYTYYKLDGTKLDAKPVEPGSYKVVASVLESNTYLGASTEPIEFKILKSTFEPTEKLPEGVVVEIVESENGFDPNAVLVVKVIELEEDELVDANEILTNAEYLNDSLKIFGAYDVTLFLNDVVIQPDGDLLIKISVPQELIGKEFSFYHIHINDLNQAEVITPVISDIDEDNCFTFTTDKLSSFVFVGAKDTEPVPGPNPGDNTKHFLHWLLVIILVVCVTIGVLFELLFNTNPDKKIKAHLIPIISSVVLFISSLILLFFNKCTFCIVMSIVNMVVALLGLVLIILKGGFINNEDNQKELSLKESLELAKAINVVGIISKKMIVDYLSNKYSEDEIKLNSRPNYTKPGKGQTEGLLQADTHYVLGAKKTCFAYVYETKESNVLILLRLDLETVKELKKSYKFKLSGFPKAPSGNLWYSFVVDNSYTADDIYKLLDIAYNCNKVSKED